MKQIDLFQMEKVKDEFGGELLIGKRKSRRPISTKHPLHLVLRADVSRSGTLTHYKRRGPIERLIHIYKKKYGVKIYRLAVVKNHIHLLIKVDRRESYTSFVRVLTGVMAKRLQVKWPWRPFTRIVQWGRDFTSAARYVIQNQMESAGVIRYKPRKTFLPRTVAGRLNVPGAFT